MKTCCENHDCNQGRNCPNRAPASQEAAFTYVLKMNDKELLELAAKAAGIEGMWDNKSKCFVPADGPIIWEPLSHDGDALRLAVKLGLDVCIDSIHEKEQRTFVIGFSDSHSCKTIDAVELHGDPYAATRRAIVRAAAAIGEQMK